jgi:uncharacterized BrkB/YihY/UPF0761 family membrane protein
MEIDPMKRISDWLNKVSSGWVTLAAVIIFVLFSALVLPGQSARSEEEGGSERSPDLSLYYSADDLYQMAEEYGEAGREAYIRARFTFDIAWPLVYTFFLVTTISWIYSRTFPPESWWQRANLAPIMAMVFDLLENLSTSLVMYRFPERTPVVDSLATVFTSLKWFFVTGSFLLLIGGILVGLRRWYKRRRAAEGNLIS